ncbi:Tat pathway signal protein, partial [Halorubrum sp. Atlit-26R]
MSDKDITRRSILKKIGVGSAVGSFASTGAVAAAENNSTSKSPPKESQPQIEVLAENDSQAIFRLKESGVSHLYRDFSGGVHKSNKEEKNKQ